MGYYRPRPSEVKNCKYCGIPFETNHKRAIYCGSSCRTLAYNARHGHETEKAGSAKGDLNFSLQSVGTVATGAGIAAVANHLLHDEPAHRQVMAELATIRQQQVALAAKVQQLTEGQKRTSTYIDAQMSTDPKLQAAFALTVARQNLQIAQERGDVAKIEEFTRQIQAYQVKTLLFGR